MSEFHFSCLCLCLALRKTIRETIHFSEGHPSVFLQHPICKWESGSFWMAKIDAPKSLHFVYRQSPPWIANYSYFNHHCDKFGYLVSQTTKDEGLQWQEGEENIGNKVTAKMPNKLESWGQGTVSNFMSQNLMHNLSPDTPGFPHPDNVLSQHLSLHMLGLVPGRTFLGLLVINSPFQAQPKWPPMWELPFTRLLTCTTEWNVDLHLCVGFPPTQHFLRTEVMLGRSLCLHRLRHSKHSITTCSKKDEVIYGEQTE